MPDRPGFPRLPLEPLYELSGVAYEAERWRISNWGSHPTLQPPCRSQWKNELVPSAPALLADRLGIPRRTALRWVELGGVPLYSADTAAIVACGKHPATVWGDLWWAACAEEAENERAIEERRREGKRIRNRRRVERQREARRLAREDAA